MERKLIPQGLGGFTIYLPKKWVTKKGLKEGDVVSIIESNTELIISKDKQSDKDITISITEDNESFLMYYLTHVYRKDVTKIILVGKNLPMQHINSLADTLLLGFMVTKATPTECILENVAEPSGERYDILLRRLFFIIKDNISSLNVAMQEANRDALTTINASKEQFDKFAFFCKRTIYHDRHAKDPLVHWELLTCLTQLQHALVYFSQELTKKFAIDTNIHTLIIGLADYFQSLYTSFFSLDSISFTKLMRDREKYHFGGIQQLLKNNPSGEIAIYLAHLQHIFRLVQVSASPVFELYLEQTNI